MGFMVGDAAPGVAYLKSAEERRTSLQPIHFNGAEKPFAGAELLSLETTLAWLAAPAPLQVHKAPQGQALLVGFVLCVARVHTHTHTYWTSIAPPPLVFTLPCPVTFWFAQKSLEPDSYTQIIVPCLENDLLHPPFFKCVF